MHLGGDGEFAVVGWGAHAHVLDQAKEVLSIEEAGVVDEVFQGKRWVVKVSDLTK
jgi:hypothetical protein